LNQQSGAEAAQLEFGIHHYLKTTCEMQFQSKMSGPLLEVLINQFPDSSKSTIRTWIKAGRVQIGDLPVNRIDHPVEEGQTIQLVRKKQYAQELFPILYQDPHILVVEKPEGMLSVATAFEKGNTVHAILKSMYKPRKVFVVHRLDQETSGVMLFALSELAYKRLKQKFEAHDIERVYCGIVKGRLNAEEGSWSSYLYEDARYLVHSSQNPQAGSLAVTHYAVVNCKGPFSRVEFRLETGKKNQIRVHCQDAGHPIVGDKKYGGIDEEPYKGGKRLFLHAQTLAFTHPIKGVYMHFTSPVPEAFNRLVGA
jgi:23S rRNA pseudouridine1911/1915/1917 synthase